jgi:hypothetical protein
MTSIAEVTVNCAVCGQPSTQIRVNSTNQFGSPDLDTRPPEMMRSALRWYIQRCPNCGYCAPKLSDESAAATSAMQSDRYAETLQNADLPEAAQAFFCYSIIKESEEQFAAAGWASVQAAWQCDDKALEGAAVDYRMNAVRLFRLARDREDEFVDIPGGEAALLTDLLRRAGRFDEARNECVQVDGAAVEDVIKSLLDYQLVLVNAGDQGSHTVAEALEDEHQSHEHP